MADRDDTRQDGRHESPADAPREMPLAELARRAGVPPRTIRFYISRGLLPGPLRRGRNAAYGPAHLEALEEIRRLRAQGLTLAQVRSRLAAAGREGGGPAPSLPEPSSWWLLEVAPGVVVQVRADLPAARLREVRAALSQLARRLAPDTAPASTDERNGKEDDTP